MANINFSLHTDDAALANRAENLLSDILDIVAATRTDGDNTYANLGSSKNREVGGHNLNDYDAGWPDISTVERPY